MQLTQYRAFSFFKTNIFNEKSQVSVKFVSYNDDSW